MSVIQFQLQNWLSIKRLLRYTVSPLAGNEPAAQPRSKSLGTRLPAALWFLPFLSAYSCIFRHCSWLGHSELCSSVTLNSVAQSQNKDYTEAQFLGFSYDFGVTVIRHQNADAMALASALMRGIHPLIIFKMATSRGESFQHIFKFFNRKVTIN